MKSYLKNMLMEDITETLGDLLDRAFEEGKMAGYVEFIKLHPDGDFSDEPSPYTKGFRAGLLQAYNENPQFGTPADEGIGYINTQEGNVELESWDDDDPQIQNKA